MRANAIARVIDKLDIHRAAKAIETIQARFGEELPPQSTEPLAEAAGAVPGHPDIIPPSLPELPDLPAEAMGAASGRPEPVPTSRPELLPAAMGFCPATGLPMVAMADGRDEEECEEAGDYVV
jgi:hypothetical protein